MSEEIQKYYMIGNAHLDPVWLWRWQKGSAEAKAQHLCTSSVKTDNRKTTVRYVI